MFFLSSCSSGYFLYQAGRGQLRLWNRSKPIEEVLLEPSTSPELRALLSRIPEIKAFGENSGLKATPNYRDYVKLDQDSVVYVVTVSEALEFRPVLFRFPLVGSFNYLGWFDEKDARDFADRYQKQGKDVDVRGASAFSTLGWFRDPLLSSMIPISKEGVHPNALPELVNVILHESVHATLYVKNQSYFNESLASFLADVLTERYFAGQTVGLRENYRHYLEDHARSRELRKRMAKAYGDLKMIFDSGDTSEEKSRKKELYLTHLQEEVGFRRKITNATLIQFQTYDPGDQGFSELLQKTDGDVRTFLALLSKLTEADFEHPQREEVRGVLGKLIPSRFRPSGL